MNKLQHSETAMAHRHTRERTCRTVCWIEVGMEIRYFWIYCCYSYGDGLHVFSIYVFETLHVSRSSIRSISVTLSPCFLSSRIRAYVLPRPILIKVAGNWNWSHIVDVQLLHTTLAHIQLFSPNSNQMWTHGSTVNLWFYYIFINITLTIYFLTTNMSIECQRCECVCSFDYLWLFPFGVQIAWMQVELV